MQIGILMSINWFFDYTEKYVFINSPKIGKMFKYGQILNMCNDFHGIFYIPDIRITITSFTQMNLLAQSWPSPPPGPAWPHWWPKWRNNCWPPSRNRAELGPRWAGSAPTGWRWRWVGWRGTKLGSEGCWTADTRSTTCWRSATARRTIWKRYQGMLDRFGKYTHFYLLVAFSFLTYDSILNSWSSICELKIMTQMLNGLKLETITAVQL